MQIGTEEEPWYFEAIRRLDPRISYEDLYMRMMDVKSRSETDEGTFKNRYINNSLSRSFRPKFKIIAWFGRDTEARNRIVAKLSPAQTAANTTRGLTPGLVNPHKPYGDRIPVPRSGPNQGRKPGSRKGIQKKNEPLVASSPSGKSEDERASVALPQNTQEKAAERQEDQERIATLEDVVAQTTHEQADSGSSPPTSLISKIPRYRAREAPAVRPNPRLVAILPAPSEFPNQFPIVAIRSADAPSRSDFNHSNDTYQHGQSQSSPVTGPQLNQPEFDIAMASFSESLPMQHTPLQPESSFPGVQHTDG